MPFTPTHILAITPIAAVFRRLPLSALAIGSMTPDIPMFFPVASYAVTHSPLGIFTTCLPIGMAGFVLFQYVLKVPLLSLLPRWFQQRLSEYSQPFLLPSFRFYTFVALSIVIGSASHIFWDAFTHQGRWGTQILPILNNEFTVAGWTPPGYKVFQYGSTFVGLPLIAVMAFMTLIRTTPSPNPHLYELNWTVKIALTVVLMLIPCVVAAMVFRTEATTYVKVGRTITISGAVLLAAVLVYSLLVHAIAKRVAAQDGTTKSRH